MNRNQKIALGCGGAGCLGLIVLAVVGVFGYLTYMKTSPTFANQNRNSNFNTNLNTNDDSSINNNTTADEDTSSSMSDDDKHRLFQAVGVTGDSQLTMKVLTKIGFRSGIGEEYQKFSEEHFSWAMKNLEFIKTVNTPEKGRAYVEAHIDG
ncbi:MAG: hypothetical protein ACR2H6_09075 [Pyrinomonadaceae bacterium]